MGLRVSRRPNFSLRSTFHGWGARSERIQFPVSTQSPRGEGGDDSKISYQIPHQFQNPVPPGTSVRRCKAVGLGVGFSPAAVRAARRRKFHTDDRDALQKSHSHQSGAFGGRFPGADRDESRNHHHSKTELYTLSSRTSLSGSFIVLSYGHPAILARQERAAARILPFTTMPTEKAGRILSWRMRITSDRPPVTVESRVPIGAPGELQSARPKRWSGVVRY
eukprot:1481253-Prymnesium_polylepis.1